MAKYVYQKGQKPLTIEEIKYVRLHPTLGYAITSQNHYSDFIIKAFYIITKIMTAAVSHRT